MERVGPARRAWCVVSVIGLAAAATLAVAGTTAGTALANGRPTTTTSSTTTTTSASTTTTAPSGGSSGLPPGGEVVGPKGNCLDDVNAKVTAGNKIQNESCSTGQVAEIWSIAADGTFRVLGGCMDVSGTTAGSLVEYEPCNGAATQVWSHQSNNEIVNNASGLCLDDPHSSSASQLTIQSCSGSSEQLWSLPAGPDTAADQTVLGPNAYVFTPSMSAASIQDTVDSVFAQQEANQFGTQRYALLFEPGTYSTYINVGFYTSVAGLGLSPDSVDITGNLVVDAQWFGGNATQNFWRSASNLEVTPSGGTARWAVAQAGPFRRIDVQGALDLFPTGEGYSSGGFIADSRVTGTVTSGSQQQWLTRNSQIGSWSGGVWNMVFSGVSGAPAQAFPSQPYTTLATSPVTREEPFLYVDSSGNFNVFVPSVQANSSGTTWVNGPTPGTSVPLSSFFVANPSDTASQIDTALANGQDILFTPGVYDISQTINVTNADTVVTGLGLPTLVPEGGVNTMDVADVAGVNVSGLLFDAGTTNSAALLTVGTAGSTNNYSSDPVTIDDDFFRIGGDIAGQATQSLVDNSNYSIIDDIWAWRADHGNPGTTGWTVNTAANGLVVNGNNVTAYGLFVEHYQQYEVMWNGQGGTDIFFQNENPYDPPSQAAWEVSSSQVGYPAFLLASNVTSFQGYGMGSYCYFDQGVPIYNAMAFQAPDLSTDQFHDILTMFLSGSGGINSVINGVGAAVNSTSSGPSDVTTYP
ncbi:MAG TPA: RICIN domain-containing protein [Acidimicrobiales bacterium]|nr:RICIN domain-containing protein [Acidimicrobiales bacterium]